MAMLQLSGQLSNATVRITPRVSWWITAQNLLSASSVAASPNPDAEPSKEEKVAKKLEKQKPVVLTENVKVDKSLISAAFKNLLNPSLETSSNQEPSKYTKTINDRIRKAINVKEVLEISEDPNFDKENASTAIFVLYNWIMFGKIRMSDIYNDKRYTKLCKTLDIDTKALTPFAHNSNRKNIEKYTVSLEGLLQAEKAKKQIERLNVQETITVLTTLASKQKRSTSLLNNLATQISGSKEKLNIKQLGDILYSMSVLTFYDETLIKKVSQDLLEVIPTNKVSSVIGSILTSIGLLRYKNEQLLNVLSEWILQNKNTVRPQEINSLLMTVAHLGYTPKNFNDINENIVKSLKESDMCQSSNWLDIVWALTVLNQASTEHYESVLNGGFLSRLFDVSEAWASKILKLLNVNAAARLISPDYKGPLLPEESSLFETTITRNKDKIELSNCIVSALKMLLPSDSGYLNTNVNTKMGFLIDAEFCFDSRGTPLLINAKSNKEKEVFRIGVLASPYHEFCRGSPEVIGPVNLYKKLLELQGYKVLLIPYSKVNIRDKLVTRVKYINDNLKLLLPSEKSEKE